jgi:hypothetical protein
MPLAHLDPLVAGLLDSGKVAGGTKFLGWRGGSSDSIGFGATDAATAGQIRDRQWSDKPAEQPGMWAALTG